MSDGTTALLIFREGATRSNEVAYTKIENIKAPDVAVPWEPGEDTVAEHYELQDGKLVYAPPPPPAQVDPGKLSEIQETIADIATNPKISDADFLAALRLSYAKPTEKDARDEAWQPIKERIADSATAAVEAEVKPK